MKNCRIVTACYNEEDNVELLHDQISAVMKALPQYAYEHIYIDNASLIRLSQFFENLRKNDKTVKVILNAETLVTYAHRIMAYYKQMVMLC
jgi:hypothetical protein